MIGNSRLKSTDVLSGFGAEHTAAKWAEMLGMTAGQFRFLVDNMHMTVEQIYKQIGLNYSPPGRKPRIGKEVELTQRLFFDLLQNSGYVEYTDPYDLVVVEVAGNQAHLVYLEESYIGRYRYKKRGLTLSNGDGINFSLLDFDDIKISRNQDGTWAADPSTKKLLLDKIIGSESQVFEPWEQDMLSRKRENETEKGYLAFGERKTLREWADIMSVHPSTLSRFLKKGGTLEGYAEKNGIEIRK